MKDKGYSCNAIRCNVSNKHECESTVEHIINMTGKIDVLVNNAGITKDKIMLMQPSDDWEQVIKVDLFGTYNMIKYTAMDMIKNRKGVIINMSSIAGLIGVAGQTNYCASKAAIMAMTRALVKEIGHKNICINAIAPGYIDTEMTSEIKGIGDMKTQIPQRRFGKAKEVSSVVLFLASDEASYINGQTIVVDGGLTA